MATEASTTTPVPPPGAVSVFDHLLNLEKDLKSFRQRQAECIGLRPPLYNLLSLAYAQGEKGITVSQAAAVLGVRPQALSNPVTELENQGLLLREVDGEDGRARRLTCTKAGFDKLEKAQTIGRELDREITAKIPASSVAVLILSKLSEALKKAATD